MIRILTKKYIDVPKGTVIKILKSIYDKYHCEMYTNKGTYEFYARIDEITKVSKDLNGGL